jgi:GDP-L-fucose synthase
MTFWKNKRVLVTGGAGFLGSHVVGLLEERGAAEIRVPRSAAGDLRIAENCRDAVNGADIVIHLAAKVGGIAFNQDKPGEIVRDNLLMGVQLMEAARLAGVSKYVTVGTTCCYPRDTPIPFCEDDLWNGYPEAITAPYGLAKRMLLVMGQAYREQFGFNSIFLLPVNLYGPGDHFDTGYSHVIPALIKKTVDSRNSGENQVTVWGTGKATREFLYVKDAARGILLAAEKYDGGAPVNLGSGIETPVKDVVGLIAEIVGYTGEIVWDRNRPDGQPRRCVDTGRARQAFGFEAETGLREGLTETIEWYIAHSGSKTAVNVIS